MALELIKINTFQLQRKTKTYNLFKYQNKKRRKKEENSPINK